MTVTSELGTLAETTMPNAYDISPDEEKKQHLDDSAPEEDPFGSEECAEVKYRTLGWWHCGILMVAENVSIGILSLPSAVATLGLVPAIIIMIGISFIAWYTAYIIYQFKMRYLHIHSMGDAGEVILGRFGRELLGGGQLLFLVFVMASHILTFTVAMNTITDHGTCTIVFGVVALVISCIGSLPRTLGNVYWISFASFLSIAIAVIVTMIAVGVQNTGSIHLDAVTHHSFKTQFLAVSNILFAYVGHASFFGFVSEMEHPREFPKSIAVLQVIDTSLYIVSAVVIYRYVGVDVASPALSSAGPVMKKVAYGLALPTVLIAGIVNGHVAAKYVYVRLFRGTNHMHETTFLSRGSWVAIALVLWVLSWVIAESIPIFNDLLSFITALLGCWFAFGFPAIFWFVLNKGQWFSSPWKIFLSVINLCILGIAFITCGLGLWVSGDAISNDSNNSVWTCASNGV
ncbi:amino acid transporter [Aspergillus saccharolyticus JOP 1030-1]|uniref:Amino acid transporter n=1 Tax=Aspergillus saccharolyticus JOP 1030-1 TaxID=1450539 RepID=A0A318ZQW8_9EURO|nr:amino acid transporter [Aspergillus saccharolyticus JOP 1030-1]PYH48964.1 amino acid transporter [Aspergillus saccharolyticus JOP 1030-1]